MANIQPEIAKISAATYGGEVRSSIVSALNKINTGTEEDIEEIRGVAQDALDEIDEFVQGELDPTLTSAILPAQAKAVGDAVADLKSALSDIDSRIFTDIAVEVGSITGIITKTGYSGSITNTSTRQGILLSENASYDSYYIVLQESAEIWFDTIDSDYLAICYGQYLGEETEGTDLVLTSDNAVRKRKTDNNLPTANNKLYLPAGYVISFTLTAGSSVAVYGISKSKIIKTTFKDEILSETEEHIEEFESSIFVEAVVGTSVRSITGITTKTGYSGSITNTSQRQGILLGENSNYDSYYIIMDSDIDIWFDTVAVDYLAICYGEYLGTETQGTDIVLFSNNAVRKRKSENNLPTVNNKLHLPSGYALAITLTAGADVAVYGFVGKTINPDFRNEILAGDIGKGKYIKYSGTGSGYTEKVEVYLPATVGFIRYDLYHVVDNNKNCDIWRIAYAYAVNDNFLETTALTTTGEWECAVHLKDRDDFSGGSIHGDEVLTDVQFFVNGKAVDISTYTVLTKIEEFVMVETSNLYDPDDSTTVIASHGSSHIFDDVVKIKQSLKWVVAERLTACYLAMFPPAKAVTNRLYTNKGFEILTLTGARQEVDDATECNIYSVDSGFMAYFAVNKYPKGIGNSGDYFLTTDNNGNNYNKCYYTITDNNTTYTTTVNEEWDAETVYKLNIT